MNYHMAIDMWSLGCILAELYTGFPIFPGENEQEQLACIMEVLGVPDKDFINRSSRRKLFFGKLWIYDSFSRLFKALQIPAGLPGLSSIPKAENVAQVPRHWLRSFAPMMRTSSILLRNVLFGIRNGG